MPNAIGGGGATLPQNYYNGSDFGEYQYISLSEIVDNFTAAYVGEGKILGNTLKGDVNYHAHRALQELSYDTLKSCKSLELEVCPSLKVPLPHDYVNYVKFTWVDEKGIEYIIYPTSKTSNPFSVEQNQDNCEDCGDSSSSYQYTGSDLTSQEIACGTEDITCTFSTTNLIDSTHLGSNHVRDYILANPGIYNTEPLKQAYWDLWFGHVDEYCLCLQNNGAEDNCGVQLDWASFDINASNYYSEMSVNGGWTNLQSLTGTIFRTTAIQGLWPAITTAVETSTPTSNTWDNYKSGSGSTSSTIDPTNMGRRYGLDPQFAQTNGSYYIDCINGMIHFSSALSGKTIIIKYISDGVGTDEESIVPKLAEEAMYKWIAYGCASARMDIPEGVIQRLKREKFAETRKAKIRLSNIKIEEITQIMRGKAKFIDH